MERRAAADPRVQRLRTHPGVGRQVAAYCGLAHQEYFSGERIHHGGISKQGNRRLLRALLVEAARGAIRHCEELRRFYFHLAAHKSSGVAVASKLAVRLYACCGMTPITKSPGVEVETRGVPACPGLTPGQSAVVIMSLERSHGCLIATRSDQRLRTARAKEDEKPSFKLTSARTSWKSTGT